MISSIFATLSKIIVAPLILVMSVAGYTPTPTDQLNDLHTELQQLQAKVSQQDSMPQPAPASVSAPVLGAFSPAGGGTYTLRSTSAPTDTTIRLASFREPRSNIPFTISYLGSAINYGTLDPQTSRSEFISFTGITQYSDGRADLTGVTRGLTRTPAGSSCTASTTLASTHAGQSQFILSDSPCLFAEYAVKRNDEVITGSWTVLTPTASGNPTTKAYVDALALGGSPTEDKLTVAGTAGTSLTAGKLVALGSNGLWYPTDADVATTTDHVLFGIAQGTGAVGGSISGGVLLRGLDTNQSGLTIGGTQYVSNTTGGISSTAGTFKRVIGIARSSTNLYFDPDYDGHASPVEVQRGTYTFASSTIGSDAYALALNPKLPTLQTGSRAQFRADVDNIGLATLNIDSLGAKNIIKATSTQLADSDIRAGELVDVIYDGTNFQLQTPMLGGMVQIASTTLTANATSITLGNIPARRWMIAQIYTEGFSPSPDQLAVQFNNDTSNNYSYRSSYNGGADDTGTAAASIIFSPGGVITGPNLAVVQIGNTSTTTKMVQFTVGGGGGSAAAPSRAEGYGVWSGGASRISTITIKSNNSNSILAGSKVLIYGSQD